MIIPINPSQLSFDAQQAVRLRRGDMVRRLIRYDKTPVAMLALGTLPGTAFGMACAAWFPAYHFDMGTFAIAGIGGCLPHRCARHFWHNFWVENHYTPRYLPVRWRSRKLENRLKHSRSRPGRILERFDRLVDNDPKDRVKIYPVCNSVGSKK